MERTRKSYGISPVPPNCPDRARYRTGEAAAVLHLHRNTITSEFRAGRLRPIDPNAEKLRYSGRELNRYWDWKTKQG